MKKYFLLIWLLLLFHQTSLAQLNNTNFYDSLAVKPEYSKSLFLQLNTFSFVKNNEYFNQIADGYTLFGYQATPKLVYFPSENLRIEAGAFFSKDFGNNSYTQIAPVFTIKYQKNGFAFLFGNLESSLNHRLIEPLYDFERVIKDRLENGFQLTYKHRTFDIDTWINWEKMIYRGSPFQEELTAGLSSNLNLINNPDWKISIPLQLVTSHQGGQIDSTNLPAITLVNAAAGLAIEKNISENGFFRSISTQNYLVYNKYLATVVGPFQEGNGLYLNITANTKWISVMGSYWKGNKFVSNKGGALYESVSRSYANPSYTEADREIFMLRFLHSRPLTDELMFDARLEPFYDLNSKQIEFSAGIYLHYRPLFRLKKEIKTND